MPESKRSPTASIPSKHRGRGTRNEMRDSLIVTKLDSMASHVEDDTGQVLEEVNIPHSEALSVVNSSRLKKDIKFKLNSMEYDQRSLELLIRLIKSGPLARDVTNDENRAPPPPNVPAPSIENCDVADDESETARSGMFLITSASKASPRIRSAVTVDPSARFRKSIEALKGTRERFGVSMSVNGSIAKARNVQKRNIQDRKADRNKLPMLSTPSTGDNSEVAKTPRVSIMRPWLTLSGRRIQLKHQGHVERVLDHPEPKFDYVNRPRKKRHPSSAPPSGSINTALPLQRFAWSDGNKFVLHKVNKSFRYTRSPIDFSQTIHGYHGFQSLSPNLDVVGKSEDVTESKQTMQNSSKIEKTEEEKPNDQITTKSVEIVSNQIASPPPSCHSNDTISRPSSSTMPRPVRSVVIKLPQTTSTTLPSPTMMTSFPMTSSRTVKAPPSKPIIKVDSKRPG